MLYKFLLILAVTVINAIYGLSPDAADAAARIRPATCVAAHASPSSHKAAVCRRHGWVVKTWVVVSPRRYIHYWSPARTCRKAEASDTLQLGCVFPPNDPAHRPGWLTTNTRTGMMTIHYAHRTGRSA